jgi:tape measure domain-containing protein
MADERTVKVTLRAEVGQYNKAMGDAAKATERVGSSSKKSSQESTSAFGRMLQSAEQNRASWEAVGRGMLTVGAATAAVGVAALKTGIEYNTLQQTTRAALTSLLGSTEAAADQMDRLDDFARNSPFAKQTFITAQQQMLAFGIETQKVIPYLDAVQNAVAAAGGSNADIAAIAETMSKISAAGKITGQDLIEFGNRGVNAAELIGSQMGKTGAQIREDITSGTLSADDALDALAAGMSERFAGAADNVKNTFSGAMDRVRAAWRDFASELATPLVDPNGGGALVDLLNWAADMMRAFSDLPGPVRTTVTALGGLVAVVGLLGGALALVIPRIAAANTALTNFATRGAAAATTVKAIRLAAVGLPAVVGAAAIAFGLWATKSAEAKAAVDRYVDTLDEAGRATEDTVRVISQALTEGQDLGWNDFFGNYDLIRNAEKMGIAVQDLAGYILGEADAVDRVTAAWQEYIGTGFGSLQREIDVQRMTTALDNQVGVLDQAEKKKLIQAEVSKGLATQEGRTASAIDGFSASTEESTSAIQQQIDALQKQQEELRESADNAADADRAQIRFKEAVDRAKDAVKENGRTLDLNTKKGRDNKNALLDMRDAALQDVDAQKKLGASSNDLRSRMESQRRKFIDVARQMGLTKQQANNLADEYGLIPSQVSTDVVAQGVARYKARMDEARAAANSIPSSRTTTLTQHIRQVGSLVSAAFGGGRASGGLIGGFADGGMVPGTPPADSSQDNLLARTQDGTLYGLQSGEFVQRRAAVRHYGIPAMQAINDGRVPKEVLRGFANGGVVPGGAPASSSVSTMTATAYFTDAQVSILAQAFREGSGRAFAAGSAVQDARARYARGGI